MTVYAIALEKTASLVSHQAAIPSALLYSLTRNRAGVYARNRAVVLACKLAGCMVKDIDRHFQREPMTISQGIIKVEQLIHNDTMLKKH